MNKIISTVVAIGCGLAVSACGGGGGGGASTGANPIPQPPAPPVVVTPTINVSDALIRFLDADKANANLASNDGYLGKASLSVTAEQSYPFVTNGSSLPTTFTRTVAFLQNDASGRLLSRNTWKFHFDAQVKPIGLGVGHANAGFTDCMSVTAKNDLPAASNGSGIYFSGVQSGNYSETFRNATQAHYCDPTQATTASVMWSVEAGSPNPYACMTMPESASTAKTKMCVPVNPAGTLGTAMWVRVYRADGSVAADFKDSSSNTPVETYSTVIDPKNYYYGTVWRPQDGFVYQSYPNTQFSSEQACRNQTVIDWKKTYSADNIGWSCVHSTSN